MTDYTKDQFIYEANNEKRSAYGSVLYDVLVNNEQ